MPDPEIDELWRQALSEGPATWRNARRILARLPAPPRCKSCAAPFTGIGSVFAGAIGLRPWSRNPAFCEGCISGLTKRGIGGAEVELSFLFSDIRGSTPMAEGMTATEFARTLDRFYAAATDVLVRHDAMVDSFVGDEVIGMFIPGLTGPDHARKAIDAATALLEATGHGTGEAWVPIGTGVHTGVAYVGAVGSEGQVMDIKALGDPVNTTARLASAAAQGEVLVSDAIAEAAGIDVTGLEHRNLDLKGKSETVGVHVISAGPTTH